VSILLSAVKNVYFDSLMTLFLAELSSALAGTVFASILEAGWPAAFVKQSPKM
jgi:hypothetical protein